MLKCVIVDDEPLALEVLTGYIDADAELDLAGSFGNARDALSYLKAHAVDVLFLDIEMPEMSGLDLLRALDQAPITVFTTAFRNYAFEGFELGVIDFLLKPISRGRFQLAIEKINDFLALKKANLDMEPETKTPEFIFIKSGVDRIKMVFADVIYIQGLKDYAIIHLDSGRIVTKGSIKYMQELFPERLFIRVHKSFMVSKSRIGRIAKNKVIIGAHQVPVGRNYRDDLEKIISA
ncbi:MAG: two component transcriptional regulator, LytTR family [Mucilaginibacter sp.]|nr:two component transcriptional regulator, LytTR family [Mucilaginibacter sp.]